MTETFKYRAFISYSHADRAWGDWLHRALESYRIPKRLTGVQGREGPVPAKLFPIFRDREELASSPNLSDQIRQALEQSAYLVIICSPNSARSRWVNEEILAFKRLGREHRILALIAEGEANAADPSRECFPQALKFKLGADGELTEIRTEPVAADAREQGDGRDNAKLKLIAGLLGIEFDALKQRELEVARRRTRVAYGIAAAMLLLAVVAGGAGWLAYVNERKAERQLDEALAQRSRFLVTKAEDARRSGAADQTSLLLVEAVKAADKRSRALLPWFARLTLGSQRQQRDRAGPAAARRVDPRRRVQPGRPSRRDRVSGQDGAAMGCGDRTACSDPRRPWQHRPVRFVQSRRPIGADHVGRPHRAALARAGRQAAA